MSRLAFVDHTSALGGAELALASLASALDLSRWRPVAFLGEAGPLEARLRGLGVDTEVVPLASRLRRPGSGTIRLADPVAGLAGLVASRRLAGRLRTVGASLLHANSLRACLLGGVAARLAGLPCVWQVHSIVAPPVVSAGSAAIFRVLAGVLPSCVVCNSEATAAALGLTSKRVRVIPIGVDASRFVSGASTARRGARVGMVARIAPLKGQHVFLEAARRVAAAWPEVEFVLAGEPLFGEERYARTLRHQAAGLRVRFLGFVDDVPALLRDLDVVVHVSVQPEGMGQAVVEAMLSGRPVVATGLGGTAELVEDGVTGRIVPAGDARALADAVSSLLADPRSAAELGRRAQKAARERFDLGRYAREMDGVYQEVLAA
jgi:glycosyltransferase involved in cell wall biosynthesis